MSDTHHDAQHARIVALEATVDRLRGSVAKLRIALDESLDDVAITGNMPTPRYRELRALTVDEEQTP